MGVSQEVAVKMSPSGLEASDGLAETRGPASKISHSHGCGQEPSVPRRLSTLTTWLPPSSEQVIPKEQDGSHNVSDDRASEAVFCHFRPVLLVTRAGSPQRGWGLHRRENTRRWTGSTGGTLPSLPGGGAGVAPSVNQLRS